MIGVGSFGRIVGSIDVSVRDHPMIFLLKALNLSDAERTMLVRKACEFSALGYSYLRCGLVGLDELTGGDMFTRYLTEWNLEPICSFLVAESYRAIGKDFGKGAEAISPQDILTFSQTHPQFYEVLKLKDDLLL